jgi:hypothetical protein
MRRATLVMLIVLLALLAGATTYQLLLGGRHDRPSCGPASPGGLPTRGACVTTPP